MIELVAILMLVFAVIFVVLEAVALSRHSPHMTQNVAGGIEGGNPLLNPTYGARLLVPLPVSGC